MAHELTIRDTGFVEHAYVGEVGWHGLGNELRPDAPMVEWVKAAGFDWEVLSDQVRYRAPDGNEHTVDNRRVLYRSDTSEPLSVVSADYKIVQPQEIMDYFDQLISRAGFKMNTAGTLFGGRRFWALADIGDEDCVADPKDRLKGRLLAATSVDLTMPTTLKFLCERVVCNNTLTFGLAEMGGTSIRVPHSREFRFGEINAALGIKLHDQFHGVMQGLRRLAQAPMDDLAVVRATAEILQPEAFKLEPEKLAELLNSQPARAIGGSAIEGTTIGADLMGASGTSWGWLNAVTEYADHTSRAASLDNRFARAMFGEGDRLKQRALNVATKFADGETLEDQYQPHRKMLEEVLAG